MRYWLAIRAVLLCSAAFAEPVKVAVLPFEEIGDTEKVGGKSNWVTKAIAQSLADELAQMPGVDVVSTASTQPSQSRFAVTGTLQRVDEQLRVTGHVADTTANKSVGGFKATATERELFTLEDSVAEQVKAILRAQIPEAAGPVVPANAPPIAARTGRIFEGSDLQRAVTDPRPLRPPTRVTQVPPPLYYDDDLYVPRYRSYVSYPTYPIYSSYPFCYRPTFFKHCFTPTFVGTRVTITSHAQNYSRGSGLIAAYPSLTANFVPRNEAIAVFRR